MIIVPWTFKALLEWRFLIAYIYQNLEDILKSTLPIKVSFGVTSAEYHRYQFEIGAMITCNHHPCQGFASLWSLLWPQTHCSCLHRSAHPGRLFLEGHPSGQWSTFGVICLQSLSERVTSWCLGAFDHVFFSKWCRRLGKQIFVWSKLIVFVGYDVG